MSTRRILRFALFSLCLLFTACKIEAPITVNAQVDAGNLTSSLAALSCAASIPSATATSGIPIPITLQVSGGIAPYTYSGVVGDFSAQTTFSKTYTNTNTTDTIETDTFTISDGAGGSVSCSLSVTVTPINPVTDLACALAADNATPSVNALVTLSLSASGGAAPYVYSDFSAGRAGQIVGNVLMTSLSTATASVRYTSAGLSTALVYLSDATGARVSCSRVITVGSQPSVSVSASPSVTVAAGTSITLNSVVSNFSSSPTLSFSTSASYVTMTTSGSSVVVGSNDSLAHSFTVYVVASNGTQSASTSINLSFTTSPALLCSMNHTSGSHQVGENVAFGIYSSTGEALTVTSFSVQDGIVTDSSYTQTMHAQFNSAGSKLVTAQARSASSGRLCNGGASITDTLNIQSGLACSATTIYNPSYVGEFFLAKAIVAGNSGVGRVRIINIQTSWNANVSNSYYNTDLSSYLAIYNRGSFPIVLTIQDDSGATATCSLTQVVY